jgi:hypothetical protein
MLPQLPPGLPQGQLQQQQQQQQQQQLGPIGSSLINQAMGLSSTAPPGVPFLPLSFPSVKYLI